MVEAITPLRLKLLRLVAEHPGIAGDKLRSLPGVTPADLAYLIQVGLVDEREAGCYRLSHLGQMALRRA